MFSSPAHATEPLMSKDEELSAVSRPVPAVSYFLRLPSELRNMVYRILLVPSSGWFLNPSIAAERYTNLPKVHTPILGVNRQIHFEASSVIYSELRVRIHPGDIVCLRSRWNDIAMPSTKIWKHNPLYGMGSTGPNCDRIYSTHTMNGLMEPHIFSRFKNILFELEFDFLRGTIPGYRPIRVDSEMEVNSKDSSEISRLLCPTRQKSGSLSSFYEFAVPARNEHLCHDEASARKYFEVVYTRAVEIFIESGVMNILRDLTNVDLAVVGVIQPWDLQLQELQPKYEDMICGLAWDIHIPFKYSTAPSHWLSPGAAESEVDESEEHDSEEDGSEEYESEEDEAEEIESEEDDESVEDDDDRDREANDATVD